MDPTPSHDPRAEPGYETSDAHTRPILIAGLVLVVAVVLVALFLRGMLGALEGDRPERFSVEEARQGEDSFTILYAQLRQLHKDEVSTLGHYAFDSKTGVARIPIDRAMDLIAERGAPKGKGLKTDVQLNSRESDKK